MKSELSLIRELSELFGPTGCEDEVAAYIEGLLPDLADSFCRDRMGNVIALCRMGDVAASDRKKVMISAHMDEVGVMVTEICEDGLLRFDTVGGIHVSVLEGRKVTLGDETKRICGVVASKAIHHKKKEDRNKPTPINKLYIDIGAADREEAEKRIGVGDFGTFDSEFYCFGKDGWLMKGKALDDRMGCAAMLAVMEFLRKNPIEKNLDLYFCFTVREEIGLSGAKTAAAKIAPDYAIVLESTAVADLPEVDEAKRVSALGGGMAISLMDRSTIYGRAFVDRALSLAKERGISAQIKRYVSGGNDAGSIHKTGVGVKTLALSVPTRYLHSPSCVASIADYRAGRDLTEALLRYGLPLEENEKGDRTK